MTFSVSQGNSTIVETRIVSGEHHSNANVSEVALAITHDCGAFDYAPCGAPLGMTDLRFVWGDGPLRLGGDAEEAV
jgi:hypothetical protein